MVGGPPEGLYRGDGGWVCGDGHRVPLRYDQSANAGQRGLVARAALLLPGGVAEGRAEGAVQGEMGERVDE